MAETVTFDILARDRGSPVVKNLGRNVERAGKDMTRSGRRMGVGFSKSFGGGLRAHMSTAMRTGLATAVTGFGLAVAGIARAGIGYQDTLLSLQATSRVTERQMEAVRETAKRLGADMRLPATSAKDAADAMLELSKGGLSVGKSMKAALGTLRLSSAAQIDAAQAAAIQVATMNQFRLGAKAATRVADVLANTANAASGEITDVAGAMTYVGPVARGLKVSVEDAATAIGLLAKNGIIGEKAGTALRGSLSGLANPSEKAAKGLKTLGVEAFTAEGRFVGMRKLVDQLHDAQGRLTDQQFAQAAAMAFGREPLAAINALASEGAGAFDDMGAAVKRQGGAADVARAKTQGLRGAMEAVKSQLETVAIQIYERAEPAVSSLLRTVAEKIPQVVSNVAGVAGGIQAAFDRFKPDLSRLVTNIADRFKAFGQDLIAAVNVGLGTGDWSVLGRTLGAKLGEALVGGGGIAGQLTKAFAGVDWFSLGKRAAAAAVPFVIGFTNALAWEFLKAVKSHPIDAAIFVTSFIPIGQVAGLLARIFGKLPIAGPILRSLAATGKLVERAFVAMFRGAWRALRFFAPALARRVGDAVDNVVTRVYVWADDAAKAMVRFGRRMIDGLLNPLRGLGDRAGGVVNSGLRRVFGLFRGAGVWLIRAGKDMVLGFIGGIRSLAGQAARAAGDMARRAIDAAKSLLDLGSPSKLFMRFGRWVSEGLALGISRSSAFAASKAGKLADRVIAAVRSKLQGTRGKIGNLHSAFSGIVSGVASGVRGSYDPTQRTGIESQLSGLRGAVSRSRRFASALAKMARKGYPTGLIQQIAAAGPDGGLQPALAFAGANRAQAAQARRDYGALGAIGRQAGQITARSTGLDEQLRHYRRLENQLERVARRLAAQDTRRVEIVSRRGRLYLHFEAEKKRDRRRGKRGRG